MKVLVINGSPKKEGFTPGALDIVSSALEARAVEVERLRLSERRIQDCIGCFQCLRTGRCVLDDDMGGVIEAMLAADGFVVGSPVRNGQTTACFKRFYERITYLLGFTCLLDDKATLAISSVGVAGGRAVNKRMLGLRAPFNTRLSGYLFFRVGIPTRLTPERARPRLERAADKLVRDIRRGKRHSLKDRLAMAVDRLVMRKLLFARSPEAYAHVLECWKRKGLV